MKTFALMTAAAALLVASAPAHATTFAFTYTFNSGDYATGTFTGKADGNVISDVADFTLAYDGTDLSGPYTITADPGYAVVFTVDGVGAYWNANGPGGDNAMAVENYVGGSYVGLGTYDAGNVQGEDYISANWTVDARPDGVAVPEPTNAALLIAGLGSMGFVVRRRKVIAQD